MPLKSSDHLAASTRRDLAVDHLARESDGQREQQIESDRHHASSFSATRRNSVAIARGTVPSGDCHRVTPGCRKAGSMMSIRLYLLFPLAVALASKVIDRQVPSGRSREMVTGFQRHIRQMVAQMPAEGLSPRAIATELRLVAEKLEA